MRGPKCRVQGRAGVSPRLRNCEWFSTCNPSVLTLHCLRRGPVLWGDRMSLRLSADVPRTRPSPLRRVSVRPVRVEEVRRGDTCRVASCPGELSRGSDSHRLQRSFCPLFLLVPQSSDARGVRGDTPPILVSSLLPRPSGLLPPSPPHLSTTISALVFSFVSALTSPTPQGPWSFREGVDGPGPILGGRWATEILRALI